MPLIRKDAGPQAPPTQVAGNLLTRGTPDERWSAARELGGDPSHVATLAAALLTEEEPRVREAILTSLAKSGGPEAVAAVMPHLRSDDASLRTGALDALRAMPSAVAPRLADLLQDPDPDVRILACELVRYAPAEQASKLLATLLEHDPEINVCAAAVEILAEVGGADVLVPLSECARRFSHASFLRFSIEVTLARISAGAPQRGG